MREWERVRERGVSIHYNNSYLHVSVWESENENECERVRVRVREEYLYNIITHSYLYKSASERVRE